MPKSNFQQVQKIISKIESLEKDISRFPQRRCVIRSMKKLICVETPGFNDQYICYLTDDDIQLLIDSRKEHIRLLKDQLRSFGVNV